MAHQVAGSLCRVMLVWMVSLSFSLFGHHIVLWLWRILGWHTALVGWAGASAAGLFAGKSSKSTGAENDDQPRLSGFEAAAVVALIYSSLVSCF